MTMRLFSIAFALCAAPVFAQDLSFDPAPTVACLDSGGGASCIGTAASLCMEQSGGQTTVGMGFCASEEWEWWDARLNQTYRQLMAEEKATDAEMKEIGATVPSLAMTLRDMQRAWIPFRDATCDYERAQWGGGTGGGPATAMCLMTLTGTQTLYLERFLGDGM